MAKSENRRPKRPRIRYSRPKPKAKEAEYRNSLGNFELFRPNGIVNVKKLLKLFEKLIMQKKVPNYKWAITPYSEHLKSEKSSIC